MPADSRLDGGRACATGYALGGLRPAIGNSMRIALSASILLAIAPVALAAEGDLRSFSFGPLGDVLAAEVLHTPGVWEGAIVGPGPRAGGWLMEVQTNRGTVLVARGGDGSVIQLLPTEDGFVAHDFGTTLPDCGGAIEVPVPKPGEGGTAGACDDGSTLDVMVRWTSTASAAAGGETAIAALAEATVAISNHVYAASGVALRMRGVSYAPSTDPYTGDAGSPLSEMRTVGDGILDSVHAERDAVGADLVSLLTGTHPSYCGVAYLLGGNSPEWGFSVVVWSCALGGLTFTHEIGHNQGCCHAPGDGGGCTTGGVFPYSVGNRFTASDGVQYRTVLAYSPGTRIPRLSSPTVLFKGTATGSADADNARTLNETAASMANYRCGVADPRVRPQVESPLLAVPVTGGSSAFTATAVPAAAAGGTVDILVTAVGNLGAANEALSLRIGSTNLGTVIGGTGTDCGVYARRSSIPAASFNAAIGPGASVPVTLTATSAVTNTCSYNEARVVFRYRAACTGDLDGDGTVGGSDLGALLGQWGACSGCAGDVNRDGAVNGADIGVLLGAWGSCP